MMHQRLRSGVYSSPYLDDVLLKERNNVLLLKALNCFRLLTVKLGLLINLEISLLVPSQDFTHLGIHFLTQLNRLKLPEDRAEKLVKCVRDFLGLQSPTDTDFLVLFGTLECGSGFVGVSTPTHETHPISLTCPMEDKALSSGPSSSYIGRDTECLHSMLNHRWLTDGVLIPHPQAQLVLMTDVSRSGWGSVLLPHKAEASGHWNCSEADLYINILELKTVFLVLKVFLPTVHYKVLLPHNTEASGHWNSS